MLCQLAGLHMTGHIVTVVGITSWDVAPLDTPLRLLRTPLLLAPLLLLFGTCRTHSRAAAHPAKQQYALWLKQGPTRRQQYHAPVQDTSSDSPVCELAGCALDP
jgi:hypothetical protein